MKYIPMTILVILVSFVSDLIGVKGQTNDMACSEIKRKMISGQIDAMTSCTKQMNFQSASERMEKSSCIIKCVLTTFGIIKADGSLDKERLEKKMEEKAPTALIPKAKELANDCAKEHGPKLNPSDPACKSYEPLVTCLRNIMLQVCP